jgi:hypothetical protein
MKKNLLLILLSLCSFSAFAASGDYTCTSQMPDGNYVISEDQIAATLEANCDKTKPFAFSLKYADGSNLKIVCCFQR